MNEEELDQAWTTLQPGTDQRRRIRARVFDWLDARDTSLVAEWLGLFKVAPLTAVCLVTASAAAIVVATPLFWLMRGLI